MSTLNDWNTTDANNNATPPDGWPENMDYNQVNDTGRAVQGTLARFFNDINGSLAAAGLVNAYTLTLNESGYTAYFDGMYFTCSIPITNTSTTVTMNVNGIGARNVVNAEGSALAVGDLVAGGMYSFYDDGTNLRVVSNPFTAAEKTKLAGLSAGGRNGCSVYGSGNQTINTASTEMLWDSERYDDDSFHDTVSNTGRLTVPSGVTRVRLSYHLRATVGNGNVFRTFLRKNGSDGNLSGDQRCDISTTGSGGTESNTIVSHVLDVTAGDYFVLMASHSSVSTNGFLPSSFFAMDVVE